jgi:integrase/recombinase XerC
MRRAELLGLRWADIDNAAMLISVKGKGNKERRVPISPDMVQLLKDFKNEQQQHFLGNDITYVIVNVKGSQAYPEMIYRTVKKYLSLCSTQKKKSPHVLRHSFATHLSANGAQLNDIKELLGHSSLASTQVYTHATIEQLKEVYKITHPKSKVK